MAKSQKDATTFLDELQEMAAATSNGERQQRIKTMKCTHKKIATAILELIPKVTAKLDAKKRALSQVAILHFEAKRVKKCGEHVFSKEYQKMQKKVIEELKTKYLEPIDEHIFDTLKADFVSFREKMEKERAVLLEEKTWLEKQQNDRLAFEGLEGKINRLRKAESSMNNLGWFCVGACIVAACACALPAVALAAAVETGIVVGALAVGGIAFTVAGVTSYYSDAARKEKERVEREIDEGQAQLGMHKKLDELAAQTILKHERMAKQCEVIETLIKDAETDAVALRNVLANLDIKKETLAQNMEAGIIDILASEQNAEAVWSQVWLIEEAEFRAKELEKSGYASLNKATEPIQEEDSCVGCKALIIPNSIMDGKTKGACFDNFGMYAHSFCTKARSFTFVNMSCYEVRMLFSDDCGELSLLGKAAANAGVAKVGGSPGLACNRDDLSKPEIAILKPGDEKTIERNTSRIYVNAGVRHWGYVARQEYFHMFYENKMMEWAPGKRHVLTQRLVEYSKSYTLKNDVYPHSERV